MISWFRKNKPKGPAFSSLDSRREISRTPLIGATEPTYNLLVPSNSVGFGIVGSIGNAPDVSLLQFPYEHCRRRTLPPFLNSLVFKCGADSQLRNIYFNHDLFLVTSDMRQVLESSGAKFQTMAAKVQNRNGKLVPDEYWAMKLQTRIDCLDQERSFARWPLGRQDETPLAKCVIERQLVEDLIFDFANGENGKYKSYPDENYIVNLELRKNQIPSSISMFEVEGWPGRVFVESSFARAMEKACRGEGFGYYFWLLDLNRISASRNDLWTQLR